MVLTLDFLETTFPVIPIQILTALLAPFLSSTTTEHQFISNTTPPAIHNDIGYTVIHTLDMKIPHQ